MQSLHLSRHAGRVTATDSVPRALQLAAAGFALSAVDVELLEGDLTEPVADREFDLVVCNPPFVVGPSSRFAYRDSGRAGDAMSHASVIGSTFDGRIVSETTVGDRPAIVPAIRGSAWITGITQVLVDPTDPFPEGYLLSDTWPGPDVQF